MKMDKRIKKHVAALLSASVAFQVFPPIVLASDLESVGNIEQMEGKQNEIATFSYDENGKLISIDSIGNIQKDINDSDKQINENQLDEPKPQEKENIKNDLDNIDGSGNVESDDDLKKENVDTDIPSLKVSQKETIEQQNTIQKIEQSVVQPEIEKSILSIQQTEEELLETVIEEEGIIEFDLSMGDVVFTDDEYNGFDKNGEVLTGEHKEENVYKISQGTTQTNNTIFVGSVEKATTKKFEIHLNNVNIDAPKTVADHAAAIYVNTEKDNVYLIADDNTSNQLKAYGKIFQTGSKTLLTESERFGHAAIEKEINTQGTLIITCEEGYKKYQQNSNDGHDCAKDGSCGSLTASIVGDAGGNSSGQTRTGAAAAIGSKAEVSQTANNRTSLSGAPTMGTLHNLVIAGGQITATGTKGNTNTVDGKKIYLGGSPGIGVGAGFQQYSVGYAMDNLKITGGNIDAIAGDGSAACIGGGYHAGYVEVNIYGGTINTTKVSTTGLSNTADKRRGPGIGGGGGGATSNATAGATINIHGGTVTATSEYGAAIGSGAGGSSGMAQPAIINIYNGYIDAKTEKGVGDGAGAAIGTGGSLGTGKGGEAKVNISGGTIIASSELGADIGGGGTNSTGTSGVGGKGIITISGGDITSKIGGIGGGNANAGVGGDAELTITGGKINATKISGGGSKKNNGGAAIVKINGGTLRTGSIGGGSTNTATKKIGYAKAEITNGDISGQFLMAAGGTNPCSFTMSGGTLHSVDTSNTETFNYVQKNGAVVYMDDPNGVVNITGGTIEKCSANNGGAIYMTAGTLTIGNEDEESEQSTKASILNCSAQNDGGAIYLGGGTMTVKNNAVFAENNTEQHGGSIYINEGNFEMFGGEIHDCNATNGGAVYVNGGSLTLNEGKLYNNKATNGGAAYISGGNFIMNNGEFTNNSAADNGGAIYVNTDTIDVEISVFDGKISDNIAGNHGGAIGANAENDCSISLTIGLKDCMGEQTNLHEDDLCPEIKNNTASKLGGAFCLHGNKDKLDVNIYCGNILSNLAIRNPGSNSLNQGGGTVTVWAGKIDPGIMVGGGVYTDNRITAEQTYLRFWSNFEGGPADPHLVEVTEGVTVTFPLDTYVWEGHELSGWSTTPDASGLYVPANGQYAIEDGESNYLDFYAAWDIESSYVVYIPDEYDLRDKSPNQMDIKADVNYFKANSILEISVESDFELKCNNNEQNILDYELYSSELGNQKIIKSGDIIATFQYNNKITKVITAKISNNQENKKRYADGYEDMLTFTIKYREVYD